MIGQIALGTKNPINPLSVSPDYFSQIPSGPASSVVFFEGTAIRLRLLPDAMLFAAKWWLPTLMLFLGVPAWFRRVTGGRRWGYLAVALIVFSPSNLWWSGRPINTLGFVFAACALLLLAHEKRIRRRWLGFGLCIVGAAILTARYSTYYQPLAIVLGLPVFLATAAFILASEGKLRRKLGTVGAFAAVGAAVAAAVAWENIDAIRSGLNTVYPGRRVSTGEQIYVGRIFGAPAMGTLDRTQWTLVGNNATDISSSFTILILVVGLLAVASRWRGGRAMGAATWAAGVMTLFWLSWCTINYGGLGAALPIINRVPAPRAASAVGFLAIFTFCLYMAQWKPTRPTKTAASAGLLTLLFTAYGGASLQATGMSLLSNRVIWASAVLAGMCVFAMVRWPASRLPLIATTAAVALLAVDTNPLEFGLADLRASSTAKTMLKLGSQSRTHGQLWASDDVTFDSLMFATATPALSSRQQIGPNDKEWLKLDPGGANRRFWNRGGSFIRFTWRDQPGIQWALPYADQIVMTMSPCTLATDEPALRFVVSTARLSESCLTFDRTLLWSGTQHWVYTVR
ncbi:MAG: hypothetical protein M3O28_07805 [Actinomycetota bacterium]|nr:hypothetical protein [Actinomycetota bacterium]